MPTVARRHHFLPQGYLAGFTDSGRKDGMLHVLDLQESRSFRTSPLNVAVEKDFKRIDIEGLPPDAIENALAPIEDRAIQAIRRVTESREFPSDEDHNLILNLLSLVIVQNPKSRRNLNSARTRVADEKLKWLVASQANWEHHLSLAQQTDEEFKGDVSYERARQFVEGRHYIIDFGNEGTLREEFRAHDELLTALGKRTWTVLIAPEDSSFITSDYPFSLVMEHGFHGHPSFLTQNTELFFPISKKAGFIGILGTPLKPVINVRADVVARMNTRVSRQADRRLFLAEDNFLAYGRGGVVTVRA
ncbi:DUF4238 domain-containing protein [Acidovorax sp. Root267]|uniref:DUF4238 domain-containing protein n=1 Tax=Acidovorax sp. Root267 TaxID=1736505 RepID=UPI0009E7EF86|nr:DUF4238 domain-containing protein [Acidovorax sp. Root267]